MDTMRRFITLICYGQFCIPAGKYTFGDLQGPALFPPINLEVVFLELINEGPPS